MAGDPRKLLEFLDRDRLRVTCEKRRLAGTGTAAELRDRLVASFRGDLDALLPLLWRGEMLAFIVAHDLESTGYLAAFNRASRDELERTVRLLIATGERLARPEPARPAAPVSPTGALTEKVQRVGVKREGDRIYYVKDGDIWSAPRRPAKKDGPALVRKVGLVADHLTYLYFVDGDGDIARKRRDGAPIEPSPRARVPQPAVPAPASSGALPVFIAYSHEDLPLRQQLENALAPYRRAGKLDVFVDHRLEPGEAWETELLASLAQARIVMLILSNDFLASEYCMTKELPQALEQRRQGRSEVVPILARPCRFEVIEELGAIQVIQPHGHSVADHPHRDKAWHAVTQQLDRVIARVKTGSVARKR